MASSVALIHNAAVRRARAERRFARGVMVTLGALIRLADRAGRMLSFLP